MARIHYEIWKCNNDYTQDIQLLRFKEVNVKKELMKIPSFHFTIPRDPDTELTAPAIGTKIRIYRNYQEVLRGEVQKLEMRQDTIYFEGFSSADVWKYISWAFLNWKDSFVSNVLLKLTSDLGWTYGEVEDEPLERFDYDYKSYYEQLDRLAEWTGKEYLYDEINKKVHFKTFVGTDKSADIRFKRGINLDDLTVKKEQDETWDRVLALGAGEGWNQLRAVRGTGENTKVFTEKDIKKQSDLNKFADAKLAEGNQPEYIFYEAEIDPPLYNFDLGDTVWIEDDLNRINEAMRVMEYSLTFNETESIKVVFANRRKTLTDFLKKMEKGQRTLQNVHHSSAVQKGTMIVVDDEYDPIAFEVTNDTLTNTDSGNTIGDIEKKLNDTELIAGESQEKLDQVIEAKPNLVKQGYDSFEQITLPYTFPFYSASVTVKDLDTAHALDGLVSLKLEGTSTDNYVYLGETSDDYNIPLINGKTYIASCYAYNPSATSCDVRLVARANTGVYFFGTTTPIINTDGWVKLTIKFIADTTITSCVLRVETQTASIPVWFDCFKLEEVDQASTISTPWTPATITAIDASRITTGYMAFDRAKGGVLTLGGENNQDGKFYLLNAGEETIAEMDGSTNIISFDSVRAGRIISDSVLNANSQDMTLYVNHATGSDEAEVNSSTTPYQTITRALQDVPHWNNGIVTINLQSDGIEVVDMKGITGGGEINIDFQTFKLDGSIKASSCSNTIKIRNGTINFQGSDTLGIIQIFKCSYVFVDNMELFGRDVARIGFAVSDQSYGYIFQSHIQDCLNQSIMSQYTSNCLVVDCTGSGASYGITAHMGGVIAGSGSAPTGTSNFSATNGGEIRTTFSHLAGTTGTTPPAPPTTSTWNSSAGDSYRTSYSVGWRNDATVRQGQWSGYGMHKGIWLFGTAPSTAVTGKTISRIRVYLTRKSSGGNSGAMTFYIRTHNYTGKPGGEPTLSSDFVTASFSWGQSKWVDISTTAFKNAFSAGTAKGIGLYLNNTSGSYYGIFDDSAKLEITYQ